MQSDVEEIILICSINLLSNTKKDLSLFVINELYILLFDEKIGNKLKIVIDNS